MTTVVVQSAVTAEALRLMKRHGVRSKRSEAARKAHQTRLAKGTNFTSVAWTGRRLPEWMDANLNIPIAKRIDKRVKQLLESCIKNPTTCKVAVPRTPQRILVQNGLVLTRAHSPLMVVDENTLRMVQFVEHKAFAGIIETLYGCNGKQLPIVPWRLAPQSALETGEVPSWT